MKTTVKTAALMAMAVLGTAGMAWSVPTVSNVNMQQMGVTRKVQITYDLAGEDAIVTLSIETNGVAIPDSAVTRLSGDVCKVVQPGSRTITWSAGIDWPEHVTESAKARVTAWSIDAPPLYCAVDLTGGPSASSYPIAYYTSAEALPYGGLTNAIYKSSRLVMRKINNGTFIMGGIVREVTLTKDFYAGVFEVTQGQWAQVMGTWPAELHNPDWRLTRPVELVSYIDIRGNGLGAGWPGSGGVDEGTFMDKLRTKSGQAGFDLPTDAQWEYACRAGTTGEFNDGNNSGQLNDRLNLLGRYVLNGGYIDGTVEPPENCTTENGTAAVGSYIPNAWGLYDMHGNVWELCLDWYSALAEGAYTDPAGATTGLYRLYRGGSWAREELAARTLYRDADISGSRHKSIGLRLVRTLP